MVTSYYIMKMNKKSISMEEYYSGLHDMPLPEFKTKNHLKRLTMCRACLQDGDIPLTGITNSNKIIEALKMFGNIHVNDDEYRTYLCSVCYKFLSSAILFRKVAHRSNETLGKPLLDHLNDYNKFGTFLASKPNLIYSNNDNNSQEKTEATIINCPICKKIFDKSSYKVHIQLHNENIIKDPLEQDPKDDGEEVQCFVCDKFLSKSSYNIHVQLHTKNQIFEELYSDQEPESYSEVKCPICDKLLSELYYNDHLQQHNTVDSKKSLKMFAVKQLPDHLRDHEYLRMFENVKDSNKICLDAELEEYTTKGECSDESSGVYSAEKLEDSTKVESNIGKKLCKSYKIHMKLHNQNLSDQNKQPKVDRIRPNNKPSDELPICPICKKVFTHNYFKKHLELHNPNLSAQYECEICGKSFKIKSVYQCHKLRHGTDYIYKCKLCPYTGRYKERLQRHMLAHIGELKYLCPHCPARYISGGTLNIHIRKKHTKPQYKCSSCDKAFYNNLNLQRHIDAAHMGIKNHVCDICNRAFSYRRYMLRHQRFVHKSANLKPIFSKSTYRPQIRY